MMLITFKFSMDMGDFAKAVTIVDVKGGQRKSC
jgi:hypothetical protein